MDLLSMIKLYGAGQGEETMWKSISHISNFVESAKDAHPDEYKSLMKTIYADMMGGHYNMEFAKEQISKIYYTEDAVKHYGPFWTDEKMHHAYEAAKNAIPSSYNEWDFWVTLSMIKSDFNCLLDDWFPETGEEQLLSYMIDLSINFLNDDDAPHPKTKIWSYFN